MQRGTFLVGRLTSYFFNFFHFAFCCFWGIWERNSLKYEFKISRIFWLFWLPSLIFWRFHLSFGFYPWIVTLVSLLNFVKFHPWKLQIHNNCCWKETYRAERQISTSNSFIFGEHWHLSWLLPVDSFFGNKLTLLWGKWYILSFGYLFGFKSKYLPKYQSWLHCW